MVRLTVFMSEPLTYGWVWCPLNRKAASNVLAFLSLLLARLGYWVTGLDRIVRAAPLVNMRSFGWGWDGVVFF
jgi:hypothetical protein